MGFSEDMQNSLNYTRGLRRKRNYYKDKAFDPKWDKDNNFELKEIQKHKLLANKKSNQAYIEEMKEKSRKGIIAAISAGTVIIYWAIKFLL